MIKIRLKRYGKKNRPTYRIVLIESQKPRDSKTIEELGHYDPLLKQANFKFDEIMKRVGQGARLTSRVRYILKQFS
uniref:Small ribosomal subunit protein bS16c n=1 Tax=Cyanidium caldarium TaxID=2771 RepID=RR16_CYACA|nr:ribosomal protein S16 [Cyanidium caldarium]Q9TLY9.1 RecName: Full=Small ribosomal subunit protein bS16c; AltName: Full=30S ribosomal protein S16, chloroplastic [Cyanidium caldarium]AAF12966.1 unknown [Cyanidium caldarium]WDB00252.1 ribosomal protein S16 [Cyanidium caldarium]